MTAIQVIRFPKNEKVSNFFAQHLIVLIGIRDEAVQNEVIKTLRQDFRRYIDVSYHNTALESKSKRKEKN
jgi:hypothetical protein